MSGRPFSVSSAATSLNAPGNAQRADQVKPEVAILGGVGRGQPYFDVTAFAPVNDPRFGTAGFNNLYGPGRFNWDFSLFRIFRLTESAKLEFRAESFNFTNTPKFGNPAANVSTTGFGEITTATEERQFQVGLRIQF
jgi:hypothetical protein